MNRQKWLIVWVVVGLIAGSGGLLFRLKTNQKLGRPGLKVVTQAGQTSRIDLPENVLDYRSEWHDPFPEEVATLPKDTTFGRRIYQTRDGQGLVLSAVLMGTDRTSIHQPKYCLTGQGWNIESTEQLVLPVDQPRRYDLPVVRIMASRKVAQKGRIEVLRGIYVYWFVADGLVTASPGERMWWTTMGLLKNGELQRWAYVSCFAVCPPGDEAAAYRRIGQFVAAAVPEFQLATPPDRPRPVLVSGGGNP